MIRVRIAPSPTGQMHVGTARTALFNWLFSQSPLADGEGVFILRIEDTDKERSRKEYEDSILRGLEWLGLNYDEFYRQSERSEIYRGHIKKLLDSGSAFWCYHTKEELEKERENQAVRKEAPKHKCRQLTIGRKQFTAGGIIRFRNPGGKVRFNDLVRGEIEFDAGLFGDFSIAKDEETALYNLAAAIDDHDMKISHVIRGEDHISNTPKQLLIYNALELPPPEYAHLPMILGTDRSKLSKRHGATALVEYKKMGYLPDAMFNFLALLGWSPKDDKEILSREEIISQFSLKGVQKSGAVFNVEKLNWVNHEYIRGTSLNDLTVLCLPYLIERDLMASQITNYQLPITKQIQNSKFKIQNTGEEISFRCLKNVVALEQPRLKRLSEIGEATRFFFSGSKLDYAPELLRWKDMEDKEVKEILDKLKDLLIGIKEENFTKGKLEGIVMPKAEEWGNVNGKVDRGRVMWPLRVALSGMKNSPGPFEIMEVLGKEKSLKHLREALAMLNL